MAVKWQRDYRFYQTYMRTLARLYSDRRDLRSYLELTLSLLAIIIFSMFAIRPTLITIGGLLKDIEAKKEVIDQMDDKIVSLAEAQTNYETNLNDIVYLDQAAPEEVEPILYVRQIEGIAQEANVNLTYMTSEEAVEIITSEATGETSQTIKYPLTINVNGNYNEVYSFLVSLENLRQPFAVQNLSIVKDSEIEGLLNMYISGYTYYFSKVNTQP